jgi:hypothetical protein
LCILERESILEQNSQGSLALLSCWLAAAQSLESQVIEDSQSRQRLMIVTENNQLQTNK